MEQQLEWLYAFILEAVFKKRAFSVKRTTGDEIPGSTNWAISTEMASTGGQIYELVLWTISLYELIYELTHLLIFVYLSHR